MVIGIEGDFFCFQRTKREKSVEIVRKQTKWERRDTVFTKSKGIVHILDKCSL